MSWPARRWLELFLAGAAWGALAYLLALRAVGPPLWAGIIASPFIGLLVGRLTQDLFERQAGFRRALVALLSLYLGATVFGIIFGIATPLPSLKGVGEAVLAVWWGVTFTGFLLFLWPLAYFTHWLIEARSEWLRPT